MRLELLGQLDDPPDTLELEPTGILLEWLRQLSTAAFVLILLGGFLLGPGRTDAGELSSAPQPCSTAGGVLPPSDAAEGESSTSPVR
ncbi:MAG: hypothetical protein AAF533_08140 [Acidobacteriota bacterium]